MVYGALDLIGEKMKEDSLKVFFAALENARPRLEVRPRRIGGATYQVPMEVTQERGISIALRWIRECARGKKGKSMEGKLADEIMSAFKSEGSVIKREKICINRQRLIKRLLILMVIENDNRFSIKVRYGEINIYNNPSG
jgi:small subunit ribosomal protein S7